MATYAERLKDPRWQRRRLEIFNRDNWTCTHCGDKSTELHLHHNKYFGQFEPWDYPADCLETVCKTCHRRHHFPAERMVDALAEMIAAVQRPRPYVDWKEPTPRDERFARLRRYQLRKKLEAVQCAG